MSGDTPGEGLAQGRALAAHPPLGQVGQLLGRAGAGDQRLEHRPRRHPEDVGDDTGELDVRGLEDLLHAVSFSRAVLDQPRAVAHDVAQLALRRRRHEAAAEQAELEQLGEPRAVAHVRIAARHPLHMQEHVLHWSLLISFAGTGEAGLKTCITGVKVRSRTLLTDPASLPSSISYKSLSRYDRDAITSETTNLGRDASGTTTGTTVAVILFQEANSVTNELPATRRTGRPSSRRVSWLAPIFFP